MRVLIDTNIIIDAITGREPWKESAEKIFILTANQMEDIFITSNQTTDIYYLVRKYLHDVTEAKKVMEKLYSLFQIIDVVASDCINALESAISDYEDAVIEQAAKRNSMDYIVTRNGKDFEAGMIKAITPEEFLKIISEE